jgi:hypothetical protein
MSKFENAKILSTFFVCFEEKNNILKQLKEPRV